MNWVDLVIIATIIFFILESLNKSFLSEVLDFASFLLSFFISFRFYNLAGKIFETNFQIPHSLALVLGFALLWFLVEVLLFTILQIIFPKIPRLNKLDRLLHFFVVIPAILRALIFISIILILVGTFPIQPNIKKAVNKSKLGSLILSQAQLLDAPLKNIFGGLSNDSLTFFTIKPKSDESVNLGFQTTEFTLSPKPEAQMIELVNQERGKIGLNTLKFNAPLQEIARSHSADMFKRGYFSHYSPEGKTVADRAKEAEIPYLVIGENLAYAPNLQLAHNGLMNSEGHRANILSPDYHQIGIGIMDGGVYGLMITQVFSN